MDIFGYRKKRKARARLDRMFLWIIRKKKISIIVQLLKTSKKPVQTKILEIISKQEKIDFWLFYNIPDEVSELLQNSLTVKMKIWENLSKLELTPVRVLNLIKFRPLFRQEVVEYSLKKLNQGSFKDFYALEIAKEIVLNSQSQQVVEDSIRVMEGLNPSSEDLQEIIDKKPRVESLRALRRKVEKRESKEFRLLVKIEKVIEET